ncbi:MAG: membrane dipeptidase, partial [Hyphomicrobiales bacterium]|nr:membrane dipeptidase [Hyphomicrobiales bacterium]
VLSHSNAHALCAHPRNAPDDLIDAVAAGGGLVMATFVPHFVSQRSWNWVAPARDPFGKTPHGADERALRAERERVAGREPRATLADFCDHVDYLIARAGEDHVGIGSDFFGGPAPQGLGHVGRFPHLFAALLARGHSEERLVKIAGGNVLRAMREVAARGAELRVREAPRLGRIEDWDRAGTAGQ